MIRKSGKEIPVSDCLSRSYLTDTYANYKAGLDEHVHTVLQQLCVTDKRLEAVQKSILQDRQMQTLQATIVQGWPETRSACNQSVLELTSCYYGRFFEIDYHMRAETVIQKL